MKVIGIDPGEHGYAALLEDGKPVKFWPSPVVGGEGSLVYDNDAVVRQTRAWKELGVDRVFLEKLQPWPPKLASGHVNFAFGLSMGSWRVGLAAAGVSKLEVAPDVWKASLGLPPGGGDAVKRKAIELAQSLFPGVDFRPTENSDAERPEKPSSDKCEASLLAHYGSLVIQGKTAELHANLAANRAARAEKSAGTRENNKKIEDLAKQIGGEPAVLEVVNLGIDEREAKRLLANRSEKQEKARRKAAAKERREAAKLERSLAKSRAKEAAS